MRILVTGASGFIGSAVVAELLGAGHEVAGLARSDASAAKVEATGASVVRGSLDDLEGLREAAAGADGVAHLAYKHDFADLETSISSDAAAIAAFGDALAGTGRPLVIASGLLGVASGRTSTEEDRPAPGPGFAARAGNAEATLALADRGVRSSVVRLPPTVHGEGDHGFLPRLVDIARERGVVGYVGDGGQRWPGVHRLDAATLFRLALESAPAGTVLHAAAEEAIPYREVAEAVAARLGLPTASVAPEDAVEQFGFLGHVVSVDCPASSAITRELLGWRPVQPGLIEDVEKGSYA